MRWAEASSVIAEVLVTWVLWLKQISHWGLEEKVSGSPWTRLLETVGTGVDTVVAEWQTAEQWTDTHRIERRVMVWMRNAPMDSGMWTLGPSCWHYLGDWEGGRTWACIALPCLHLSLLGLKNVSFQLFPPDTLPNASARSSPWGTPSLWNYKPKQTLSSINCLGPGVLSQPQRSSSYKESGNHWRHWVSERQRGNKRMM